MGFPYNRCFLAALPSHINPFLRKTRDWHWLLILLGLGRLQVWQLAQSLITPGVQRST